jgi:hypothetical protein
MDVAGIRSPAILIDRALIQVEITPENFQHYRARFLVTRINARRLDIHLPDPAVGTIPQVFLGGKQFPLQSAEGDAIRLSLEPDLFPKPVVCEVWKRDIADHFASPRIRAGSIPRSRALGSGLSSGLAVVLSRRRLDFGAALGLARRSVHSATGQV